MRGIDSIANAYTPRSASRSMPAGSVSGSRKPTSTCPLRRRATSSGEGLRTFATASVLASKGHLSIEGVIAVAAVAAIIGDNIGYWIGRKVARPLIDRWERARRYADRVLPPAERFFQRHGGKAVFLARFFGGLRVTGAWMAGITRMQWWRFLFWNAAGGIVWAFGVSLIAFYSGKAAADAIARYGVYGGIAIGALIVLVIA